MFPTAAEFMGDAIDKADFTTAPRKGDWMQTHSGRQYWPLDPRASEVDLADIVHHLSMICRYCGACLRFYSVLEHSLGVLFALRGHRRLGRVAYPNGVLLRALLHDAAEAYCHDLIRPIKRCVAGYKEIEHANECAIYAALGLRPVSQTGEWLIKNGDNAMLLAEQAVLMAPKPAEWAPIVVPDKMLANAQRFLRLQRWLPWRRSRGWLKREFMRQYRQLQEAA